MYEQAFSLFRAWRNNYPVHAAIQFRMDLFLHGSLKDEPKDLPVCA
jgi:hypothetical protein